MEPSDATEGDEDDLLVLIVGDKDDKKTQRKSRKKTVRQKKTKKKTSTAATNSSSSVVFIEDSDSDNDDGIKNNAPPQRRMRLLPPDQQKSYIRELCKQNPKLLEDEELLIDKVAEIIANRRCPTPPPDFYNLTEDKFECAECGMKRDTVMGASRHWQDKHGPRYLICLACGADFRCQSNLFKHEKRCDSADALILLKARARFKRKLGNIPGRRLNLPFKELNEKPYISVLREEYPEEVKNMDFLVKMLCERMDAETLPLPPDDFYIINGDQFDCSRCGLTDKSRAALARHWQGAHGPRCLMCHACGADFRDIKILYCHERRCLDADAPVLQLARGKYLKQRGRGRVLPILGLPGTGHTDGGDGTVFRCNTCLAEFKSAKTLQSHTLAHIGSRPYRCPECPASFTSSNGLYVHKKNKHRNETYLCDQCDKMFGCKNSLKSHMNTHLPLPKYPCPECGKRYAQKTGLRIHIDRDHKKLPPPFACQICPKRYPKMSLLKVHMLDKHGMTLITKNMLHKTLPQLSASQLKNVHIVKKSDMDARAYSNSSTITNTFKENCQDMVCQEVAQDISIRDEDYQISKDNSQEIRFQQVDMNDTEMVEEKDVAHDQKPCGNLDDTKNEIEIEYQDPREYVKTEIKEELPSNKFLKYVKTLQDSKTKTAKPLVVIKDGQAVFFNKDNVEFYKQRKVEVNNTMKNKNIAFYKKKVVADLINSENESDTELVEPPAPSVKQVSPVKLMMNQDEIITETNNVVTMKNCQVSSPRTQTRQSPKVAVKRIRRRKHFLR